MTKGITILVLTCVTIVSNVKCELFPLSIIHINDFHARYEPTDTSGGTCDPGEECIGGYARTVHTVRSLLNELKDTNPIYINAGDSFQGTLWYNIGRWNVTSQFLNILPADAMTLGNHEFDHGVEGVVPFLETLNTTMLVANMDASDEPTIQGKYQSSLIIERSNRKIGLIGVILETTYDLANTGKLIFRNESSTILAEAEKLKAQGANIIIVISHCGYDVDQIIAKNAGSEIDVIIGSHSHTFLYTGNNPPGPDRPRGDYPTEVIHDSGHRVLIVQASAYAKYVGNITVYFDDAGKVIEYEGAPIYMGSHVPEDPEVVGTLQPWKNVIDAQGKVVIGETKVDLLRSTCDRNECNLANFVADAYVHAMIKSTPYTQKAWTNTGISFVTTGSLRVPLFRGNLTYAHLVSMSPFENILTAFNLPGEKLLEALEFGAREFELVLNITSSYSLMQVSGMKVVYNITKPVGQRVVDLKIRCSDCKIPEYEEFDANKLYRLVASNYYVGGGGGFTMLRDYATDIERGMVDIDALVLYTKVTSPIYTGLEKRITILN